MSLKRNVVANYLGQGWTALMALAFIPVYIRLLGVESYGLIGVFAVLQTCLMLLDIGMTPTLNREMARFSAGEHDAQSIHTLLRSLELLCVAAATVMFGITALLSEWIATGWLRAQSLPTPIVSQAIVMMAFVIALRFLEGVYRSALIGLQLQVWYNAANASLATLRSVGAIAVLAWIASDIRTFFLWQGIVSMITVFVFARGVRRHLPVPPRPPRYSNAALREVAVYASGMAGISLLAVLLTQVDKMLLSRLLTLQEFGVYTLAATVSGALYLVVTPIITAVYPRLVELSTQANTGQLAATYHRGAHLMTSVVAPIAIVMALFSRGLLFAWSGDTQLADAAAPILSLLAIGSFLNGLMHFPYQLQLAHAWTGLTIRLNLIAVATIIPAILWSVPIYGAVGAAWAWVILNAAYLAVGAQLMHRKLLIGEKWRWYGRDVALPFLAALVAILSSTLFLPGAASNRWHWLAFLALACLMGMLAAMLTSRTARSEALTLLARSMPKALHRH